MTIDPSTARTIGETRERRFRVAGHAPSPHRSGSKARGSVRADPTGRVRDAEPDLESRRPGNARGDHRQSAQARARRGEALVRPPRCRRSHRERRAARSGIERDDHRIQRPAGPSSAGDGLRARCRDPYLRGDLQAYRGHRGGDGRDARPRVRGDRHRRGRGAGSLPDPENRSDRRLLRTRRVPHPRIEGPIPSRRRRHLEGGAELACAGSKTTSARFRPGSSAGSGFPTSRISTKEM